MLLRLSGPRAPLLALLWSAQTSKVVELIPTARGSLARLHLLLGTTVGYARSESTYNPTILHDSEHVNRAAFDRYMQTRCRQRAWPSVSETYKARVSHKPEPKMCVYI